MGNPEPNRWYRYWRRSLMLGFGVSIGLVLIIILMGLRKIAVLTSIVAASVLIMTALAIFLLTMGRLKTELTKRDMTPRRQADEELRESEERYRKLLGATFQAIVIHTDEGIILEVNHAFEIMFGIPGMLATGLTILAFLVERTRELFIAQIQQRRESSFEGIGLRMDGTWLDIEVVSKAHTYKGQPILATAIRDITARKRVEHRQRVQLAISQILFEARTLDEAMPQLLQAVCETMEGVLGYVWLVDRDAKVLRWMTKWSASGVQAEEFERTSRAMTFALGEGWPGSVWKSGQPAWIQDFAEAGKLPRTSLATEGGLLGAFAFPLGNRSDISGVVECFSRELRQPDNDVFRMMADIGMKIGQFIDRKRTEEALQESEQQLRQAVKLEAIGRLAGGMAHDFNNVLTVITGYGTMLLPSLEGDSVSRARMMEILKAANRAAALTHQLLAFSRRQVLQPRILDLNAVVASIEHLLRPLIGEDVEFVIVPGGALSAIRADPGQLEQVLMNLAVNARDAMPQGGRLTIMTANLELHDLIRSKTHHVPPGSYVVLSVTDTGCGMDAATQAKIFETFFTTKEKGRGTGLGLATVYGIVEQSGGHIEVISVQGRGTTFMIYFPRVEGVGQPVEPEVSLQKLCGGSETILLVEDERAVRDLLRQVLQRYGYTVLEASYPEQALELSQCHKGPIHLLVTDVVMPMMSGLELAGETRAMRPSLRVLYMSGYTDNVRDLPHVVNAMSSFLQKPFSPDILVHKVREVLDMPASPAIGDPRQAQ